MIKKILIFLAIFLFGLAIGPIYKSEIMNSEDALWYIGALILGLAFILMGLYSLFSGRVYGRSMEKYFGGWIGKESAGYYWGYTLMYLIAGFLLLFGCAVLV